MKALFATIVLSAASVFALSASADVPHPVSKQVNLTISEVYVPGGFSSNTDSVVIVSGMFPNSCYKWDRADVVSPTPLQQEVTSIAQVSQEMCLMVMIPYQKEVNLGKLVSGQHNVRFLNGDGTYFEKTLSVE